MMSSDHSLNAQNPLDFSSLEIIERPFTLFGKTYLLREASGGAACQWRNALLKSTKLGPEGKPIAIDGMADSEPLLVSLCVYELYEVKGKNGPEQRERPVPIGTVRSWPSRVQKKLFEEIKLISDLNENETTETLQKQVREAQDKLKKIREKEDAAKQAETNGMPEHGEMEEPDPNAAHDPSTAGSE